MISFFLWKKNHHRGKSNSTSEWWICSAAVMQFCIATCPNTTTDAAICGCRRLSISTACMHFDARSAIPVCTASVSAIRTRHVSRTSPTGTVKSTTTNCWCHEDVDDDKLILWAYPTAPRHFQVIITTEALSFLFVLLYKVNLFNVFLATLC